MITLSDRCRLEKSATRLRNPTFGAGAGATALALAVKGVDAGNANSEDLLNGDLDLSLVRVRVHVEGVLVLVEQPVALLRDHRPQQDVPRVADPAHLLASLADLDTNAVRACSVKTT
jgi:hypothetical protein